MRVAVIGASGRSGRAVVEHALAAGHQVIAVVRRAHSSPLPSEMTEIAEARDVSGLQIALRGADSVISALGHVKGDGDETLLADGATALVAAMKAAGVRRVVAVSAAGAFVAGDDPLSRYLAKPLVARLFGGAFADTRAMEQVFAASDTDWTMLRPSRLIAGIGTPDYRRRVDLAVRWHYSTKFDTVGRAAVDALTNPQWVGHPVFITE